MKNLFNLRLPIGATLAIAASSALILFAGTACQSKKGAKGPATVGADVKMVELRQVIQSQIVDRNRGAELMKMVSVAEYELGAINESFIKHSKDLGKMSGKHSVTAGEMHVALREWDGEASDHRVRITDALLAMKKHATAEEWPALSNAFINSVMRQSDRYKSLRPSNS